MFRLFFFHYPAPTEIYTLSLHDALPISLYKASGRPCCRSQRPTRSRCASTVPARSEEHTSELQSHSDLVCRLLLEKKKTLPFRLTQAQLRVIIEIFGDLAQRQPLCRLVQ